MAEDSDLSGVVTRAGEELQVKEDLVRELTEEARLIALSDI